MTAPPVLRLRIPQSLRSNFLPSVSYLSFLPRQGNHHLNHHLSHHLPLHHLYHSRHCHLYHGRHHHHSYSYSSHHRPLLSTSPAAARQPPSRRKQTRAVTMAATDPVSQLSAQLEKLGPIHQYPNYNPEANPQDIYRAHITSIFHDITGVDRTIIYNALQWTMSLDKGDLVLAIPALRVKGKPNELGQQWLEKVCMPSNGRRRIPFSSCPCSCPCPSSCADRHARFAVARLPARRKTHPQRSLHTLLLQTGPSDTIPHTNRSEAGPRLWHE